MRKLYISTKEAWLASHQACHFHPATGTHYIDLKGGLILVAADFHTEGGEEAFSNHPDVAPLPDPVFEGKVKMREHVANTARKYCQVHHDALSATLGVTDEDTVMEVSQKAQAQCKAVRISHIL